jgi:hypothetical protein
MSASSVGDLGRGEALEMRDAHPGHPGTPGLPNPGRGARLGPSLFTPIHPVRTA